MGEGRWVRGWVGVAQWRLLLLERVFGLLTPALMWVVGKGGSCRRGSWLLAVDRFTGTGARQDDSSTAAAAHDHTQQSSAPHLHTRPKPPDPISSRILYSLYSHWWGRGVTQEAEPPRPDSSDRLLVLLRERKCRRCLLLSAPLAPASSPPLLLVLLAAESSSSSLSTCCFARSCQPAGAEGPG